MIEVRIVGPHLPGKQHYLSRDINIHDIITVYFIFAVLFFYPTGLKIVLLLLRRIICAWRLMKSVNLFVCSLFHFKQKWITLPKCKILPFFSNVSDFISHNSNNLCFTIWVLKIKDYKLLIMTTKNKFLSDWAKKDWFFSISEVYAWVEDNLQHQLRADGRPRIFLLICLQ